MSQNNEELRTEVNEDSSKQLKKSYAYSKRFLKDKC